MPELVPTGRQRGSLVKQVSDDLRGEIMSGSFNIGDKLPSQSQLTERFSVSRTVIREAIASLQADGLVEAQQGAGVFVVGRTTNSPFFFQNLDHKRISSLLEMLELRAAVEIEAAGLAALRRSPAQEEAIFEAHRTVAGLISRHERSIEADFAFHQAVAGATNNPRFQEFLALLGQSAIPRSALQSGGDEAVRANYLERIVDEHRDIAHAISKGDETAAREAMRQHLKGSQQRYRALIQTDMF